MQHTSDAFSYSEPSQYLAVMSSNQWPYSLTLCLIIREIYVAVVLPEALICTVAVDTYWMLLGHANNSHKCADMHNNYINIQHDIH